MAREDLHFRLRIPEQLKAQVESAANRNKRSMTAEIIERLEESFRHRDDIKLLNEVIGYLLRTQNRSVPYSEIESEIVSKIDNEEHRLEYADPFQNGAQTALDWQGVSRPNPYERNENPDAYEKWAKGFQSVLPIIKAEQQGKIAAYDGEGARDNPFKENSEFSKHWNYGLADGYYEIFRLGRSSPK